MFNLLLGIELLGVLQLSFFILSQNKYVHLLLTPLLKIKFVNGINIVFGTSEHVDQQISRIGYTTQFVHNVNVMILLTIFVAFVLICYNFLLKKKIITFVYLSKIIRETLISLFLINCFNVSFSLGVHFTNLNENISEKIYPFSTFTVISVILMYLGIFIWFSLTSDERWGEYTERVKKGFLNEIYVPITLAYRFALGFFLGYNYLNRYTQIYSLLFVGLFILYNMINLPFKKHYHNYRALLCHFCHLIIVVVSIHYQNLGLFSHEIKMNEREKLANVEQNHKENQFGKDTFDESFALWEIYVIFICIVFSLFFLLWEIYRKLQSLMKRLNCKVIDENSEQNENKEEKINAKVLDDINTFDQCEKNEQKNENEENNNSLSKINQIS